MFDAPLEGSPKSQENTFISGSEVLENKEGAGKQFKKASKSKERIDTDKVARAAIDRAQNALELRNYLDARKTDWDRMEDLKRNLDRDMQNLDEDLRKRQQSLDERTKK